MIFFVKNTTDIMYIIICIYLLLIITSSPFACGAEENYDFGANSICPSTYDTTCIADDIKISKYYASSIQVHFFVISEMMPSCCTSLFPCTCRRNTIRLPFIPRDMISSRWNEFITFIKKDKSSYQRLYKNTFSEVLREFNKKNKKKYNTKLKNKNIATNSTKPMYTLCSQEVPIDLLDIKYKWIECDNKKDAPRFLSRTKPIISKKDNDKKNYFLEMDVGLWGYSQYLTYKNSAHYIRLILASLTTLCIYGYNNIDLFSLLLIPSALIFLYSLERKFRKLPQPEYRLINVAIQIATTNDKYDDDDISMQYHLQERLHDKITKLFSLVTISCLESIQKVIFIKDSDNIYAILRMYSSKESVKPHLENMVPNKSNIIEPDVLIPLLNYNSTHKKQYNSQGFDANCDALKLSHSKK